MIHECAVGLVLLLAPLGILAIPTTMGTNFAIALPKVIRPHDRVSTVRFSLTTFSEIGFKVILGTQFAPFEHTLKGELRLNHTKTTEYTLPEAQKTELETGRKWSITLRSELYPFGVVVHMSGALILVSSMTAIPVISWGKRYVTFHLRREPTINIISSMAGTEVNVRLALVRARLRIEVQGRRYFHGDIIPLALGSFEVFSVSVCPDPYLIESGLQEIGELEGTFITSNHPIGVVCGNCMSDTPTYGCDKVVSAPTNESVRPDEEISSQVDAVTEMLLPTEYFGTEFVAWTMPMRRVPAMLSIIPGDENATARIDVLDNYNQKFIARNASRLNPLKVTVDMNMMITSDIPVQVIFLQLAACNGEPPEQYAGATASLLVPSSQFYVLYVWSKPHFTKLDMMSIISEWDEYMDLQLNTGPLPETEWQKVYGTKELKTVVGHFNVTAGVHFLRSTRKLHFGCYLYGYTDKAAYMFVPGFQDCKLNKESMVPDDNVDNDCDGLIDEELKDGLDDDNDLLIDEDIRLPEGADGAWGDWLPWGCNDDCSYRVEARKRVCDSPAPQGRGLPCAGKDREFRPDIVCDPEKWCPDDCDTPFTFGPRCSSSCIHCSQDCNRTTGECSYCKNGYKNPKAGCVTPCDVNEWGLNCRQSCYDKCGLDCRDRVTGKCSIVVSVFYALPWVLLAGVLAVFLYVTLEMPALFEYVIHHGPAHSKGKPKRKEKAETAEGLPAATEANSKSNTHSETTVYTHGSGKSGEPGHVPESRRSKKSLALSGSSIDPF